MWAVLFVVLLDIVGFGIIVPIFPFFAESMGAKPEMVMVYIAIYMAAAFVSAPIMGRISDRYGRKPVMVVSLLGAILGYGLLATANTLWMVALSRVVSGLMAGNFSAAQAYIVDRTTAENRAKYMGLFSAAMALGYVIGPAIGTVLAGDSFENASIVKPALFAGGLCVVALIAVLIFVKESRVLAQVDHQSLPAKPSMLVSIRAISGQRVLFQVILCGLFYNLAGGLYETIFPLWAKALSVIEGPRGLLPMLLGSGLSYVLVQATVIAPLTKRFSERSLLMSSSLALLICNGLMILAGHMGSPVAVTVMMMFTAAAAGIIIPVIQIMASNLAEEQERGLVLGVIGSAGTLARTLSTVASGVLFGQVHIHAPYLAAVLVALVLLYSAKQLPRVL